MKSLRTSAAALRGTAIFCLIALVATICFLGQGNFCSHRSSSLFFETSWLGYGSRSGGNSSIAGGGGGAGEAQQQAGQRRHLPLPSECPTREEVAASHWADSCYLVNKVCVDRGMLVLYDDRYQAEPKGGVAEAPTFQAEENYGQYIYFYRNGHGVFGYPLDTIRSRGAAANEGTEYLREPSFSNCTVPVVWYPFWMNNFGHYLRDNAAKLFGFIEDTPWAGSIKLVPMTAEGLALPGFNYQLLQSMTPLRVETWADFSTRLPPGSAALLQPGPPPSAEGDHQRCFESMFICTHGLNITRWPLHAFGRHLVQTYRHLLPQEVQAVVDTVSSIVETESVRQAEDAPLEGTPDKAAEHGPTVVNVVFQKRPGDTRQILNLADLLARCNTWQHTTVAGRTIGFKCWEAEITDIVSGMTAAQLADVFVGVHGANLANGWLMRPGSSMIEIQAFGFDTHPPHLQDPLFNAEDKESQVLWWVLQGCDPGAWEPSPAEAKSKGVSNNYVKNRNVIVRWDALETALRQVAETGGDMQRYWELWKKGEWWWHVHAHHITHGGDYHLNCTSTA